MASHSHAALRARADDATVLAASAHLTDRDRYLVRLVAEHRVLTTDQLCALAFDNIITARHRLGVLVRIGVLRRFRPHRPVGSAPWHYLLGPVGAALLGAEDRDEKKWLPQVRADRQLALERSQRLAQMTGRNWFFTALIRQARHGGGRLREWQNEAEAASISHSVPLAHQERGLPNPDGLGTWEQDGRQVTFFLEYDTGTEHLPVLAAKVSDYAHLAKGLATIGRECPIVLFCFPTSRREQTARHAMATDHEAPEIRAATAALDPQLTSPAGPAVWLPLLAPERGQVPLIELAAVMPDPYLNYRLNQPQRHRQWDDPEPGRW